MTRKLLVIDDEKSITTILGKIAAGRGFDVMTVNQPASAIDTFLSFRPDIVMLDLVMPDTDGIDILRAMLATGAEARIVVMTGFGVGYLRLARGVAELLDDKQVISLEKPFRRADVLAILDDLSRDVLPARMPDQGLSRAAA